MKRRIIAVRKSGIHGRGVFALRKIRKGEMVIRYRGRVVTHEEADEGFTDDGHTFLFTLNEKYVIDGGQGGNSARWINHSCKPNCIAHSLDSSNGNPKHDRIVIEALRDIAKGEELSYNYRIEMDEELTPEFKKLWECRCGASRCSRSMVRVRA